MDVCSSLHAGANIQIGQNAVEVDAELMAVLQAAAHLGLHFLRIGVALGVCCIIGAVFWGLLCQAVPCVVGVAGREGGGAAYRAWLGHDGCTADAGAIQYFFVSTMSGVRCWAVCIRSGSGVSA